MTTEQEFCIVVEPAAGGELDEEIVALYFENKKRSGGGPIQSCVRHGQQVIITFENKGGILIKAKLLVSEVLVNQGA